MIIKRFMECCAEIQKCNIDNKAFVDFKNKYDIKKGGNKGMNEKTGGQDNSTELLQENAWLNEKMDALQNKIKSQAQEIARLKGK